MPGQRRGMTMVEMMVALLVIGVGLLALSGSAGLVTRQLGGGSRQALAATVAQAHLEKLRSLSCASVASGKDTVRGIVSTWTATSVTRGKSVSLTVQYGTTRGTRAQAYKTILPC